MNVYKESVVDVTGVTAPPTARDYCFESCFTNSVSASTCLLS